MAHQEYFVRDVMTVPAITIEPSAALLDAALMLRSGAIRHLLVVEHGRLVGLLTDRDIQRCAPSRLISITEEGYNAVFANTRVGQVMTRDPLTVTSSTPLPDAIAVMQRARHGCLPVVDDGEVVGILTRGDLIDSLHRLLIGETLHKSDPR